MDIASTQEPTKIGVLYDIVVDSRFWGWMGDFDGAMTMVFDDAVESGLLDRPVELLRRMVEGLPRGTWRSSSIRGANSSMRGRFWSSVR